MTTLADINNTLVLQNEISLETRDRVSELGGSFNTFFKMVTDASGDELEAKREQKQQTAKVQDQTQRGSGSAGRFFDFDVGNLLPLAGALLGGLLKRGIPALLAAVLADEVGEAVKDLTGSEILGSITEWATLGGAAGFLVGGVKGGIIGAVLGAVFSDGTRDFLAEKINNLIGTELKKDDWQMLAISGGLAAIGLSLPTLIGKLAGKMLPLLLSPTGLLFGLAAAVGGLAIAYVLNDDFRKSVNKALEPIFNAISDALNAVKDYVKEQINKFLPSFVTTSAEDRAIREQMAQTEAGRKLLREESNIKSRIKDVSGAKAELAGISKTDLTGLQEFASRAGMSKVYNKNIYEYDNASDLYSDLFNTLGLQQGKISTELDREGGFQEMYDAIERRLTTENATKAQAIRDAALKAKVPAQNIPDNVERLIPAQNSMISGFSALKERNLAAARIRQAKIDASKSVPPSINPSSIPQATTAAPAIISAPTTNTSIGQSSTAFVGSGTNSFDINNPNAMRAMERRLTN